MSEDTEQNNASNVTESSVVESDAVESDKSIENMPEDTRDYTSYLGPESGEFYCLRELA